MATEATNTVGRVVTPYAVLAFPRLFEPYAASEKDDPKYSCALLFDEGADLSEIKAAIAAAGREKFGDKFKDMVKNGSVKLPLRKRAEKAHLNGYGDTGHFVNCRSGQQPGIVDAAAKPIMNQSEIYPGCIVRASITFYGYNFEGNRGVGCGLNNLQKVADGDRIDGRQSAEAEFDPIPGSESKAESPAVKSDVDDIFGDM